MSLWDSFLEWLHAVQAALPQSDLVYIGAAVALMTATFPLWKKIGVFVYTNYLEPIGKFFNTFVTLPERLLSLEKKMDEKIDVLKAELKPNGGHSIKDVVNRLDVSTTGIVVQLAKMSTQANRMEGRQRSILNSVPIPTFETDAEGLCTFGNSAYLDLIGRTMDEIRGTGWKNGIHVDDRDLVIREWENAVAEGRQFEMSCRVVCRHNKMYRVYVVANPLTDNIGYIGKYQKVEPLGLYVAESSN